MNAEFREIGREQANEPVPVAVLLNVTFPATVKSVPTLEDSVTESTFDTVRFPLNNPDASQVNI